jgi:cytoskeletal protein CcmA (bactofilin family)
MFNRNRQNLTDFPLPQSAIPLAQPAVPQPQPVVSSRGARAGSILRADLIVKGTLLAAGDVQLDGKLEGDVRASRLIVGEKAIIIGDVSAEEAIIHGRIEGNISASKTQLGSTCHVEGNLLHRSLSIEAGAFFEGNCRHLEIQLAQMAEDMEPTKPAVSSQPILELHRPSASALPSEPKKVLSAID